MKIVTVDRNNMPVHMNLVQVYGAEFSKIIQDKPDQNGLFSVDPKIEGNFMGYLLYTCRIDRHREKVSRHLRSM
ncbi:hypothetical protein [uncultured Endozoicomonas sp.]|uniref:hypothetical protein n=1 Tax=uncultured Endozoicomonas sp. TaxID=432652 RepID=UPI00261A0216|nr:hypothetical protein [uncultured Endozoicomonas sp.]